MSTAPGLDAEVSATAAGTGIEIRLGGTTVVVPFAAAVDLRHELDHALAAIFAREGRATRGSGPVVQTLSLSKESHARP